ncbi:hypothetical protein A5713_22465 [Mycobacterium sp. E2497]|nr:hypothetical protein A5713_22465 [Mycobacterium sp. E2497]
MAITSSTNDDTVELSIEDVVVADPSPRQVVVRIEAAPINPSDLMAMLGDSDVDQARFTGSAEHPRVQIPLPRTRPRNPRPQALRVGQEGSGVVVATGAAARDLLGRKVAVAPRAAGMFAQYQTVSARECTVLPDDANLTAAASMSVNPLTALAITETVRLDGHTGLIHTAAASTVGQMLVKICLADDLPLVNVVRSPQQASLLRSLGAQHVCDSSQPTFTHDLLAAVTVTGATVAFDAIGGSTMAGDLLTAMEAAARSRQSTYSPFGSPERTHVYLYGHLDRSPTVLHHDNYGMFWGVSGWVMPDILARAGTERTAVLRQRVIDEIFTTFSTAHHRSVTLTGALEREAMLGYSRQTTGGKYVITPNP